MKNTLEVPRLPVWPFVFSDLALIFAAYEVGSSSSGPLVGVPLICVAIFVALGAVLLGLPFVVNYARQQEVFLVERQKEIAALAQSTASIADQISISAAGLSTINEGLNKAVRHADQLPAKLLERVNDLKAQLNEVAVTENEALAQEINALRASETEKLESAVSSIQKLARDLEHFQSTLSALLAKAGTDLAKSHSEAVISSVAKSASLIDQRIAELKATLATPVVSPVETPVPSPVEAPSQRQVKAPAPNQVETPVPNQVEAPVPSPVEATSVSTPPLPELHHQPGSSSEVETPVETPASSLVETPVSSKVETPAPSLVETPVSSLVETPPIVIRRPVPKRRESNSLELGLDIEDNYSQVDSGPSTPAISADGLTRVLVTAYIGIGNKLFARGDGPGLSQDKGTPLHFVSIGKWRWETPDAVQPFSVRLFKNDQIPASNVGPITLIPGHQTDVSAQF